jgi:hypothetical protein
MRVPPPLGWPAGKRGAGLMASDAANAQAADGCWSMPVREPLAITLSCSPDRGRRA